MKIYTQLYLVILQTERQEQKHLRPVVPNEYGWNVAQI